MANKNKKAFTLVELLAVIVILAIILVIAVPQIMNVITEARKGALISSAKLIASSAESMKISNDTLGINSEIKCEDVANISNEDYDTCKIDFINGEAYVSIIGKGKFEGMAVCSGTKDNAEVKSECNPTAVEKIERLFTLSASENGLIKDNTADQNIRYSGSNLTVKNYVNFNNELWRIIGIFNVTTEGGKTEKLIKIVRNERFTRTMSWDSSASNVNNGYGVNEWSQADLQAMLNTYYIGKSTTCGYCSGAANELECSNDCSDTIIPINSEYVKMIEKVKWNTGAISNLSVSPSKAYEEERGVLKGNSKCWNDQYCTDTVDRVTAWTGEVGLIYPSDYGFASTNTNCMENINDSTNYSCKNDNWLYIGGGYWSSYWTITAYTAGDAVKTCMIFSNGNVTDMNAYIGQSVRPSLYLKSDVSITSGDGSSSTPYQISM